MTLYQLNPNDGKIDSVDSLTAGSGDVTGPATASNNNIPLFDGTTGKVLKTSSITMPTSASNKFLRDDGTWQNPGASSEAFPIGSVYISVVATNPNTLLGYGTWTAIATGRVLVGINAGDPDFDTVEETGGFKTITSSGLVSQPTFSGDVLDSHQHDAITAGTPSGTITSIPATTYSANKIGTSGASGSPIAHTHPAPTFSGNQLSTHQHAGISAGTPSGTISQPTFTGNATSVVQPYFVVYMWKRTA